MDNSDSGAKPFVPSQAEVDATLQIIPDYNKYKLNHTELIKYIGLTAIALFLLGYIFYQNMLLSGILALCSLLFIRYFEKRMAEKRKRELMFQFRDALISISSSLGSGSVIETAIEDAISDLRIVYPYENVMIINELNAIVLKKKNGESVEHSLQNLAERANLPSITDFVDVFTTVNRIGGNNMEIIRNSISMINDRIEVENEIQVMIAGKKFEQQIMSVAPIGFVWFLSLVSGDYLKPMFTTLAGHAVMTAVLAVIVGAFIMSNKIMNIKL
jgi:tight adherence protein B